MKKLSARKINSLPIYILGLFCLYLNEELKSGIHFIFLVFNRIGICNIIIMVEIELLLLFLIFYTKLHKAKWLNGIYQFFSLSVCYKYKFKFE